MHYKQKCVESITMEKVIKEFSSHESRLCVEKLPSKCNWKTSLEGHYENEEITCGGLTWKQFSVNHQTCLGLSVASSHSHPLKRSHSVISFKHHLHMGRFFCQHEGISVTINMNFHPQTCNKST